MIICDLDHVEVIAEATQVEGSGSAYAGATSSALAQGYNSYSSTYTNTGAYADYYTAASNSSSSASASSGYYWYY